MRILNNGYKAFYKGRTCEVYAPTSFAAQAEAAKILKARKAYDVTVVLCERDDGTTVNHNGAEF